MGDQLVDIKDLGEQVKIPPKTIRNKLSNGTWPILPIRIGRALRWRQSDIDRFIRGEIGQSDQENEIRDDLYGGHDGRNSDPPNDPPSGRQR